VLGDVRFWGLSGSHLLFPSISPFDPTATFSLIWAAVLSCRKTL
jgi:hypothetical protein